MIRKRLLGLRIGCIICQIFHFVLKQSTPGSVVPLAMLSSNLDCSAPMDIVSWTFLTPGGEKTTKGVILEHPV